jgi:hypothetical protein
MRQFPLRVCLLALRTTLAVCALSVLCLRSLSTDTSLSFLSSPVPFAALTCRDGTDIFSINALHFHPVNTFASAGSDGVSSALFPRAALCSFAQVLS